MREIGFLRGNQAERCEGRREAAFRAAEGRERSAQAEAAATKMVSDAIEAGSVNALNYFIAQKYVEAFGQLAQSNQQRTVIVPADMASLVGSIAGVAELVKTAQSENTAPSPRPPRSPRGGAVPSTGG